MEGLLGVKRIHLRNGIEIKRSPLHGLGIFAGQAFRPGDRIEVSPIILLPEAERQYLRGSSLFRYYFLVDDEETPVALGLGYSSLYNHAYRANADYRISLRDATIMLTACKHIRTGEEITLNYNGPANDESPVFLPSECTPPPDISLLLESRQGLYIKNVRGKGRGVFCKRSIKKDEPIEVSPVLVLPAEDYDPVNATLLSNYFFHFNKDERTLALSLGFGSLYNHSRNSNAAYFLDRESRTMTYYALEDIPPHTEICINYSGEPGQDFSEWFEARSLEYKSS